MSTLILSTTRIITEFPDAMLRLATTPQSVIVTLPDGRLSVSGVVAVTLLDTMTTLASLSPGAMILGKLDMGSGAHRLESLSLLSFAPKQSKITAQHGPSLFVRRWTISKAGGAPALLQLTSYAIWLSDQQLGPTIPDTHSFQLLVPTTDTGGMWSFSDKHARLIVLPDGRWCFEVVAELLRDDIRLTALEFEYATNRRIYLYLNSHGGPAARLRLLVDISGAIDALQVDAPPGVTGAYPQQLVIPAAVGLQVTSTALFEDDIVPVEQIWFAQGRCEATLSRDIRVEFGFGGCARLAGAGSQWSFMSALPPHSHETTSVPQVTIEASTRGLDSVHANPLFDGLRIASLNSTGRKDEVLEASAAVIAIKLLAGPASAPLIAFSQDWLGPRSGQRSHDGLPATLDLPIKGALLRVARDFREDGHGVTPLRYTAQLPASPKTWHGELELRGAAILLPPLGSAANLAKAVSAGGGGASRGDHIVKKMPAGRVIHAAHSQGSTQLQLEADWFRNWSLESDDKLVLHDLGGMAARFTACEFKLAPAAAGAPSPAAIADGLAYEALAMMLDYIAGSYAGSAWAALFKTVLRLNLDKDALLAWARVHGLDDLAFTLDALASDVRQRDWFKKFVLDNLNEPGPEPRRDTLWPFAAALGIPLLQASTAGRVWLWDMPRQGHSRDCMLTFDFSTSARIDPVKLGLGADFLDTEPHKRPHLWPRSRATAPKSGTAAGTEGSVTDPAVKEWQGVFLADAPLVIGIDAPAGTLLACLRDSINAGLRLHYGWLDAGGHTWVADWTPDGSGKPVYPPVGDSNRLVELFLDEFESTGSRGQLVSALVKMRLRLDAIKADGGGGTTAVELRGTADLKLVGGDSSQFELLPDGPSTFSTKSLPGFDELSLLRFHTDFKTAAVDVALKPSAELAAAIPYFAQRELVASISIPVATGGTIALSVRLPAEAPTRLFDKWPIGIRGFEFTFGTDTVLNTTSVFFVLDPGIPMAKRIGGTLTIERGLSYRITMDEFAFDFALLGLQMAGKLQWREPDHTPDAGHQGTAVKIADAGQRDFYAFVSLKGLVDAAQQDFYLRISAGAQPFWVATLLNRAGASVAGATVKDAGLLLAYGAEFGGKLAGAVANPASVDRSLFPNAATPEAAVEWLKHWQPASSAKACTVGLMGTFGLNAVIASASKADNLALLWSDTGLFYGATTLNLLPMLPPAKLRLLVNFGRKRLQASLQMPASPISGGVEVSPGCLSVTLAWGDSKGIGLSIGYPPRMKDPETGDVVPDWSQAISVHISSAWPINTFQGGIKAYYFTAPKEQFGIGVAIRAGYSNSFKVTGSNIADARADVGVMVGGTFEFCRGGRAAVLPALPVYPVAADATERWLQLELARLAGTSLADPMRVSALIVGDVWGHGSVVFLGVTIAGVKIDARALFDVRGTFDEGILHMSAAYSFSVTVKIGCTRFGTRCRFAVVMIDRRDVPAGDCEPMLGDLGGRKLRTLALAFNEEMV